MQGDLGLFGYGPGSGLILFREKMCKNGDMRCSAMRATFTRHYLTERLDWPESQVTEAFDRFCFGKQHQIAGKDRVRKLKLDEYVRASIMFASHRHAYNKKRQTFRMTEHGKD